MVSHRSVALSIALAATACTVENTAITSRAIVGGEKSEPSEFIATGMLVARGRLVCTATLIAPDVALTAAHCLRPPTFGSLGFTLDTDESDGTQDIVPLAFTHQHPDFDESVDDFVDLAARNDIGIMILAAPILDIPPEVVDRPEYETALDTGHQMSLCGYGRPDWFIGSAGLKRDAEVQVDRTEFYEFSTMADGPQPCNGDSGAPLFVETSEGRRLVGIVSRAMGRSQMCNTGAIITRVAQYSSWIAKASRDRDEGTCSAGGGSSLGPLGALALLVLRRRRGRR